MIVVYKLTNEIKDYIKLITKPIQSVLKKSNPNQSDYFYKPNKTKPIQQNRFSSVYQ